MVIARIVWRGDGASAPRLLDALLASGISSTQWNGHTETDLSRVWAAVLFLPASNQINWEQNVCWVLAALDVGLNVIVVRPQHDNGAPLAALRSHLRNFGVIFSGDPNDPQHFSRLGMGGGEVRTSAFNAADLLRATHEPARVIRQSPSLQPSGASCSKREKGLLRRSFWDYSSIQVSRITGGMSGDTILRIIGSKGNERELPFVAKIMQRATMFEEAKRFEERVRDFFPFGSRPNWLNQRSFALGSYGILVGQFAERTVPLEVAIRQNGAVPAIDDLFTSVLHRWWANACMQGPINSNLPLYLGKWFDGEFKRQNLKDRAHWGHQELNLKSIPLQGIIARIARPRDMRVGRIHGDLNGKNVLIRGDSAMVIDYSHCNQGPLLADPAWLEVTVAFGSHRFPAKLTSRGHVEWMAAIERLYSKESLSQPLPMHFGEEFGDELHRMCIAIRTIRRHALSVSVSSNDYADVVALALVRFAAMRDIEKRFPQALERTARAYAAACQIVASL